jgi:HD-GYP domain-containing protein (c-di-GMP phosphodiesterase class II)
MQSGLPQEVIHEHKYGDTAVWENIVAYPLKDKHGHVGYIVETIRDVTELYKTQESLKSTLSGIIHILSNASELRDPYTAGHQRRVAQLSIAIARELGFKHGAEEVLGLAAQIHDIGKISIPAELLAKPTKLSEAEFALIKRHPISGYEILTGVEFGAPIAEVILQHHENIDGSGYPNAITGEEMLEEAKILRVADTVEAMASHRPYRAGLGEDAALKEISDNKGVIYDADVVDACLRVFKKKGFEFA